MSLVNELIKGLLPEEEKKQTTAVYAGGFKPPTSGHFEVVKQALEENPEIDEFIIFVGKKERNGVSQTESVLIWEIYNNYLPFKVKIEPTSIPPIKAVYDFAKNHPTREILWVIGAREGNEEDFKDITKRTKSISQYPNLELRTIVTSGGVSGTAARNASKVSLNKFDKFMPSMLNPEEKQEVFDLVSGKVSEGRKKKNNLNESGYDEAWELLGQPVPEIQKFVKDLGFQNDDATAKKVGAIIDNVKDTSLVSNKIPNLKNLANKGNDAETLKAIKQISGKPDAEEQYTKLMQARDAGEKRNRDYDVSSLIKAVKSGNYPSPVLLQLSSGLYVIGGRTRLYAALALGIPAKVKIIDQDTFKQKITEAKQVGSLYHYTSAEGLKGILTSNSLNASEENYLGNELYYVSFTRNKNFHNKGQNFNVKTDYRITLDGDKLSNRYKIKPFAYIPGWNYSDNWEYDWLDDEPESVRRDFFNATGDYDEQEERISFKDSNGSIPNIKDYILKVDKVSDLQENYNVEEKKLTEAIDSSKFNFAPYIASLTKHMLDNGMKLEPLPTVQMIHDDYENGEDLFGNTAYYNPGNNSVILFTYGRHPKDILRSYAHELVHVHQNMEDRLQTINTTDVNEDDYLEQLEREAYETGNIMFRSWTDSLTGNKLEEAIKKLITEKKKNKDPFGLIAYAHELGRLREEESEYKVYLDMDGVLADFDKRFKDLSGMSPSEFESKYGKNKFWDFIDEEHKISFWVGIEPMPGAADLVDAVKDYNYELLTSPSAKKQSYLGKILWVRNHTGDVFPSKPRINFKKAKEKHEIKPQLSKTDILIDDRADTIGRWNAAGGTGIVYKNISQVLNDLSKLGL